MDNSTERVLQSVCLVQLQRWSTSKTAFCILYFRHLLKGELYTNNIKKLKSEYKFTDETIKNMIETEKLIRQAGKLAHAVEWLMSGDTGQDDFNREFERVKKGLKNIQKEINFP